jgi:hypothetical protein
MKKITPLLPLLAFATTCFGQPIVQKNSLTKTDYLQKSKKQKKVAWILLAGGAAMTITGVAIPSKVIDYENPLDPFDDKYSNDWGALIIPGTIAMLTSIPFFIASSKNKKRAKAASVFINMEEVQIIQRTMIRNQSFPALGLKISL